jgi:hypothetical protein
MCIIYVVYDGEQSTKHRDIKYIFKQELGALSNQNMQADPIQGKPRSKPLRGQGQRAAPLLRWPVNQKGPGKLGDHGHIWGL